MPPTHLDPVPKLTAPSRRTRISQLMALSMGHALNDAYVNFIAPLWPQIRSGSC